MLNPQLLKIMIEMQGEDTYEENENNKPTNGSKRKFVELKKEYVTVPVRYDE